MRIAIALATGLLAACGGQDPVAKEAENASALPALNQADASPTGGAPPPEEIVRNSTEPATSPIPPALQGRWGLTPADCMSRRGDAKGLLVISGNEIRFYESVAVPTSGVLTSNNSVGGDFSFTGEGQSWTRFQSLELKDGILTRTERDPLASFRYVRCD